MANLPTVSTPDQTAREYTRRMPGSWRLPLKEDEAVTITFFPNGRFFYTIAANSALRKLMQIGTGDDWEGNWHVRANRAKPGMLERSSATVRSSFSLGEEKRPPPEKGPFLVLNFTEMRKSILNMNLLGVRMDLANWINNLMETMRDGHYRIMEMTDEELHLDGPNGPEVWHRAHNQFA